MIRDWGVFTLHCGDCRDVLRTMPDASVDSVVADPPYGDTSLDWDAVCRGWVPAVARVLKPAAPMWVFGSLRFLAPLFDEMRREGFVYSQDIVWEKQNGTGFHADRFRRVHEHAVMFYRGAWADVYHSTQYTNDATARVMRAKKRPAHTGHIDKTPYVSEDGGPRMQRSVMQVRNEHGRAVHPTQKPVDLLRPLVRYCTPPGGTVLDPFAGSGSTGVAAAGHARFIGIELDSQYVEIAERRIATAIFGPAAAVAA
jgi:site-specific DNA-methyltransferase (adenine-specific)